MKLNITAVIKKLFCRAFFNVVLLSFGYAVIVSPVLSRFHMAQYDNKREGEISRIIFDWAFIICSLIAPSYVTLLGTRVSIFTSYICHIFYISSFLWPQAKLMYAASAHLGFGAALVFVVQGQCLTEYNNPLKFHHPASIFWFIYQLFLILFDPVRKFLSLEVYDRENLIVSSSSYLQVLLFIIVSITISLTLQEPQKEYSSGGLECIPNGKDNESQEPPEGLFYAAWKPLKDFLGLIVRMKMLHFSIMLAFAGLIKNFRFLNYGDDETNKMFHFYIRIAGEIYGALFSYVFYGCCYKKGDSRTIIDVMGFVMLMSSFNFISCINLQNIDNSWESVKGLPSEKPYYYKYMVMLERFSFGFEDAYLNIQIYSLLGALFPKKSASAFALAGLHYLVGYSWLDYYISEWKLHSQLIFFFVTGTLVFISILRVEIFYVNRTSDPEDKKESQPSKKAETLKRTTDISSEIKMMNAALFNNMEKRQEILQEKSVSLDVPEVEIISEK